jgi:hypothetical protein
VASHEEGAQDPQAPLAATVTLVEKRMSDNPMAIHVSVRMSSKRGEKSSKFKLDYTLKEPLKEEPVEPLEERRCSSLLELTLARSE